MTTNTELITVEPLLPMHPDQARAAMAQFQELTAAMLTDDDWQRLTADRRFVKRSGWRKIATGYSLNCRILELDITRDDRGDPIRAQAKVAVSQGARTWEGLGGCSINEPSFAGENKRAKAEHDIPATAVTRATNRAISDLVGFGQVSAEEVDGAGVAPAAAPAPPWGPVASDEQTSNAISYVHAIAPTINAGEFVIDLTNHFQGVPEACVKMLAALSRRIAGSTPSAGPETPTPSPQTPPAPGLEVYPSDRPGRYQGD